MHSPWRVRLRGIASRVLLTLIVCVLMVMVIEVTGRLIGLDFRGTAAAWKATPIYYRQPILPVGEAFYRRPGPDTWTGKVLRRGAEMSGVLEKIYTNEQAITVAYDELGFRNPAGLTDWEIVVVGDSFTELGYLPYEDLFTSRLAELTGSRVKNLGVGSTGPLTYVYYLSNYGKSRSCKHAVMVFFEGNDTGDAASERARVEAYRSTKVRETRDLKLKEQTSFLRAIVELTGKRPKKRSVMNAHLKLNEQDRTPVTLAYAPPSRGTLSAQEKTGVEGALSDWAESAGSMGMKPWLVYMPCKERVLAGYLEFGSNAEEKYVKWKPTDLPFYIRDLCERLDIGYIDVTSALLEETHRGNLTFNAIWDTHLNRHGARVVAEVMADAMGSHLNRVPTHPQETVAR